MARVRVWLLPCLLLPLLTLACGIPLGAGPDAPALQRKRIESKIAPSTLVAGDGTRCVVSAEKYASTNLDEHVWCIWAVERTGGGGQGRVP